MAKNKGRVSIENPAYTEGERAATIEMLERLEYFSRNTRESYAYVFNDKFLPELASIFPEKRTCEN